MLSYEKRARNMNIPGAQFFFIEIVGFAATCRGGLWPPLLYRSGPGRDGLDSEL